MNMFFMFLLIFFSMIGVIRTVNIIYVYLIQIINLMIFRRNNENNGKEDIKIWMKL
jgi:amino acid transporter